jgi:hypothetical protein
MSRSSEKRVPDIFVNGMPRHVKDWYIRYEDLLDLAWPDNTLLYTDCVHIIVWYERTNGNKASVITAEVTPLETGMRFTVIDTNATPNYKGALLI